MTKEEFDSLYFGKAVHCDTEEKANHFLALADSVGYKWNSGKSLIEKKVWEYYKEKTCYEIRDDGFMFTDTNYFNSSDLKIIEYQPQSKFKVSDKVRVKDTAFTTLNGEVGVIVDMDLLSPMSYAVKAGPEGWTMWYFECQLEKVEEPIYKEEIIIDEIKSKLKEINVLLNKLKRGK